MGESGGVIKWPTQMGEILGGIFLNCVGYFRGPHHRPFSGISHTIPDTQLDNLPNRTGQRSPAGIIL
jgi:hypothetical protein